MKRVQIYTVFIFITIMFAITSRPFAQSKDFDDLLGADQAKIERYRDKSRQNSSSTSELQNIYDAVTDKQKILANYRAIGNPYYGAPVAAVLNLSQQYNEIRDNIWKIIESRKSVRAADNFGIVSVEQLDKRQKEAAHASIFADSKQSDPQIDQRLKSDAASKANKFVEKQISVVKNIATKMQNQNMTIQELSALSTELSHIVYKPASKVGMDPIKYANQDALSELTGDLEPLRIAIDDRLKKMKDRESAELIADRQKKQIEENALSLIILYAISDACSQVGQSFSASEVTKIKEETRKELDKAGIPQSKRDEQWATTQGAIAQNGFKQMPVYKLSAECRSLRSTLTYAFPQIFIKPETIPKNPF